MRSTTFGLILIIAGQLAAATPEQSPRQIVPAVASTAGLANSFWRTDLVVFNPSDRAAHLTFELLPSGFAGAGGEAPTVELGASVEPMTTVIVPDVVGAYFPDHSTGALVVSAADGDEMPVAIVVESRTWTAAGGDVGSYGQGIPAVPWTRDGPRWGEDLRYLTDLESSDEFRTNLGIVNPTSTFQETFRVEILDSAGDRVGILYYALGPQAHIQRNDILRELDLEGSGYTAEVRLHRWEEVGGGDLTAPEHPDFFAYASKVDQRSNDPTYFEAETEVTQSGLPRHRILPAAANTEGSDDSRWRTDVLIHSRGGGVAALVIELIPTGGAGIGGDRPERLLRTISGGGSLALDDIIGSVFPNHEVAALAVKGIQSGSGTIDLQVVSRTWTAVGDQGATMGQGIPGFPRRSTDVPVAVPGLEASAEFRSNLGLVNPSENLRETFSVEIFNPAGVSEGVLSYVLEPWSHLQINGILGDLDLVGSGYTAVVTLAENENLFYHASESWDPIFVAYGSKVDRKTNDPTFLEAVRLTPEPPRGEGSWWDFNADEPWYRCPGFLYPGVETSVRAFDRAAHWFGSENHRSVVSEVDFPTEGDWNQIGLRLDLECPENGLCDHWDRTGSLQLVLNPDDPQEDWEYLEIMRHITPYRVGMCQYVDITPLAPLLRGRKTLVSWIDTWVGPGHSDGEGWRITFDFMFYPGDARGADEVVNIWGRRSIAVGNLDPDHNVDSQIEPVEVPIPADTSRVEARLISTGHSFGNSNNCSEFCVLRQDLYLDGEMRSVVPWRTDCEHNPVNDQQGTWRYDRNGWCPGAVTIGQTIDITDMVTPGETATLDFDIRMQDGSEYENTNPGGGATPIEWVSLQVYTYRD